MEPRPFRVPRPVTAAIAIAWLLTACQPVASPTTSAPATTTSTPTDAHPGELPALADIPTYKATPGRTGVHPGPGPVAEPVEVWSRSVDCLVGNRTPALASGLLLVACDAPRLMALDARTGDVRWTAELAGSGLFTPSILDGVAYLGTDGKTFEAIDVATGTKRWTVDLDTSRLSAAADGRVYVGTTDGRYVGLNPADGSIDWTWTSPIGAEDLVGTVVDGTAYLSGVDSWLYAVDLANTRTAWSIRGTADRFATPTVTDDTVIVGSQPDGPVIALDRATGEERWRHTAESEGQIVPATVHEGVVYSPSSADGFYAFDLATGEVMWRADTGQMSGQAPAIVGNVIYVTADRDIQALERATGQALWQIDLGADADNSSLVSGGMLFTGDNHGMVRAFAEPAVAALIAAAPTESTAAPTPSASAREILALEATFNPDTTTGLSLPADIDIGPDGNLYVVNSRHDEILVINPDDGSLVRRWGMHGSKPGEFNFQRDADDPFSALGGVAVADDGTVYVADSVNKRVQAFSATGEFLRTWGRFGQGDGQFLDPFDVAVGPDGDVYVVDDQRDDIQRFSPEGVHAATIGKHGTGPGELNFTGGIDVAQDGTIYNADWDNQRVQAWAEDGTFLWTTGDDGSSSNSFANPADVVADGTGLIFASDKGRIQVLDDNQNVIGDFELTDVDQLLLATDGSFVYVAEHGVDTIKKLRILR